MKLGHLALRPIFCLAAFGILCISGFGQGGFQQPTAVPPINLDVSRIKIIQRIGNQVPLDAAFRDQDGKNVTIGGLLHKRPALLFAIFYRCTGVCGVELANLVATLDHMPTQLVGRDFDVIVVGIDPVETPELARAKLKQTLATSMSLRSGESGWHFLTGTMDQIHKVTNPIGFYYTYDANQDVVNHPAGLMFLTPTGIVSSYILGARYTADALTNNLEIARKNQLGIKSADIFFGCIHIDPLTGKRSIVIENVLRVAGVVTVLALVLAVLTLSGKARWRKREPKTVDEWGEPIDS